jgi:uncharacterized protein Yka (UPF0111/DUF47 family)
MTEEKVTIGKVRRLVNKSIECHMNIIINYEKMRLVLNQHPDPRIMDDMQRKEWKEKIQKIWDAIKDVQNEFYSGVDKKTEMKT